jgi:outer membrane receptor for ferrienterochelin and colicins
VFAQQLVVRIVDKLNGSPVEYAYVQTTPMRKGATVKQLTDSKGMVQVKPDFPLLLQVSCIGYRNLTDTLESGLEHEITLSPDFYQLDQVVVTGQFRPQRADKSIYRIDVIDPRQFQLKAATNMGDLLKNDLSFQFRSEGVLGDFIRIRGLSGEYVKILVDGMPVTGRVADRIDLGQLTLNNVDHVEIIEGPMSVVYGSNALAGAINIITADHAGKKFEVKGDGYFESVGTYNFTAMAATQRGHHTFSANAGRNFFAGWGPVDTSRYRTWKPKRQYMGGLGYHYNKGMVKITANTDYLHEELRDPGALTLDNLYEKALDGYHFTTRWNSRGNFTGTFNDDFVLNLQAGYSWYEKRKRTYLNDLVNLKKTLAADADLHDTTTFQMASARGFVSNVPGKAYEYQTGFDFNFESAVGKRTGGSKDITDLSGFMNLVYKPWTFLSLQPGIRVMYNSKYRAPLIYGFNVKYNPAHFVIRASYARGFRAPSLKQLYLQFIDNNHEILGNPDLKAESADNLNFSVNYDWSKNKHSVTMAVDLFYNAINNAIQLAINTQRPGWGMYFNVEGDRYKTKGIETRLGYRLSPTLGLNAGIITTGRSRLDSDAGFAWSTDFTSSLSYLFQKARLQVAAYYKYTDSYLEFAGNYNTEGELDGIAQLYVDGYHMLDLTMTRDFFNDRVSLSTGIKNLFNVTLIDTFGSITLHGSSNEGAAAGYGRTFFVRIGYRFTKI